MMMVFFDSETMCVLDNFELKQDILREAYSSKLAIHLDSTKMYNNLISTFGGQVWQEMSLNSSLNVLLVNRWRLSTNDPVVYSIPFLSLSRSRNMWPRILLQVYPRPFMDLMPFESLLTDWPSQFISYIWRLLTLSIFQ